MRILSRRLVAFVGSRRDTARWRFRTQDAANILTPQQLATLRSEPGPKWPARWLNGTTETTLTVEKGLR